MIEKSMSQRKTIRIQYDAEKKQWEQEFRRLWFLCFGDSKRYEEFYFQTVYRNNLIFCIIEKSKKYSDSMQVIGMLHLNPYLFQIENTRQRLHYIVGVATDKDYRRQGVMRSLLVTALKKLYKNEEPFTYLMPANVKYYEPFSFVSVYEEEKYRLSKEKPCQKDLEQVLYVDYKNLSAELSKEEWYILENSISEWLKGDCGAFPLHNEEYFEMLYQEKACQDGSVVFMFNRQEKAFLGFFAYGKNENGVVVEQSVYWKIEDEEVRKQFETYINAYFMEESCKIMIVRHFPYMIRIVDAVSCMRIYKDCFLKYARDHIYIRLVDDILPGNCGLYQFRVEDEQIMIERFREKEMNLTDSENDEENPAYRILDMTIEELAVYIFQKKNQKIFLAEVV